MSTEKKHDGGIALRAYLHIYIYIYTHTRIYGRAPRALDSPYTVLRFWLHDIQGCCAQVLGPSCGLFEACQLEPSKQSKPDHAARGPILVRGLKLTAQLCRGLEAARRVLVACSVVAFLFDRRLPFFASLHSSFARSLADSGANESPSNRSKPQIKRVIERATEQSNRSSECKCDVQQIAMRFTKQPSNRVNRWKDRATERTTEQSNRSTDFIKARVICDN